MAQPFGVGDVVGGRYRITDHVVTSADQDIIFQAVDEVLHRSVNVLLASRANAKQVATSAKELATGERSSEVQVLDLGLSSERTYLISTVVDPNQLLDLVVPDSAPYVEPYFTDSLGSELFGQSRQMQPQTYDDDAEYYARLQADLANSAEAGRRIPGLTRRRPSFLDKVTTDHGGPETSTPIPGASFSQRQEQTEAQASDQLRQAMTQAGDAHGIPPSEDFGPRITVATDLDVVHGAPDADSHETFGATLPWQPPEPQSSDAPATTVTEDSAAGAESALIDDEEVVDDPPEEPDSTFEARHSPVDQPGPAGPLPPPPAASSGDTGEAREQEQSLASFTSLIQAVPPPTSSAFPGTASGAKPSEGRTGSGSPDGPAALWWAAIAALVVLVLAAAVLLFWFLN